MEIAVMPRRGKSLYNRMQAQRSLRTSEAYGQTQLCPTAQAPQGRHYQLHPTIALSDFMRDLKAESSKMLKRTAGFERFKAWGEGYAALSYCLREKDMIANYIKNQREHHKAVSFRDEYVAFLKEMERDLDERDWNR